MTTCSHSRQNIENKGENVRKQTIKEYLVQWKDFPSEEATWEDEIFLQHTNLELLEDKHYWVGRTIMPPFQ